MQCPPDIAEAITKILATGLLRIRALSGSGLAAQSAIEADHLHNLPRLLVDFSPECLAYYWNAERVAYLGQIAPDRRAVWEPLWEQLKPYVTGSLLAGPVPRK